MQSFSRTRSILLTQALQQQELEGAYQRLLEQQSEATKLALVARHANDRVLLVDMAGKVQWVNEAFTRLTGYSFDEVLGQNPGDLLNHPNTEPAVSKAIEDGRRDAKPFRLEILNRHKEGHDIWMETNQVPILDNAGRAISYIAIERDMTAAKQNAHQLEEARRAAEEGGRAKSDFLATMSHEIRTPMNGVIGMAQLLEETDLDAEQTLYTDTILSSASTLLALINDILDLSKLEAGQITLNPCDFDLHRCCDETVRLLRTQAEVKGLELIVERDAALPRYLHGDDHRLRQILINLVGNAIKFTEKGRVQVSVEAEQRADGSVMLHCAIADTGIGIPTDMLTGIFERFSQADAAISRRFGGSGLGLAISRRLADAMGGRITVSSEIGAGSCFTIGLPFEPARSPDAVETTANENRIRSEGLKGLRLLVAEDNRVNRLLVQKFLKEASLELEFAKDGAEAVDMVEQFKPDVILMDVSMPVMDGLEATRIIRSSGQPQPVIIALTANAFDTDREACLAAGMDEFLTKPINRSQLLDVLAAFGDMQRRQRAG
jgi:PAS domain S-box-containing protein